MWQLLFIFIACTTNLNGLAALPDDPSASAIDIPTSPNALNFPAISTTSVLPPATTYPASATSSQSSLFPNADVSVNSFQSANSFTPGVNAYSTALVGGDFQSVTYSSTSFSPLPDFTSSNLNSYSASTASASGISVSSLNTNPPSNPRSLPTDQPPLDISSLNPFAKEVLSLPSLQNYLDLQISGIEASIIFYEIAHNVLIDFVNPQLEFLADEIAQATAKIPVLTLPIYFQAMGNRLKDFLLIKGLEVTPIFPVTYSFLVDHYVTSFNVNDAESFYKALSVAFANFITDIGYPVETEADILAHLFSSELIAVAQL